MDSDLHGSYAYTDSLKRVYYGPGCMVTALPKLLATLGVKKALVVSGRSLNTKTNVVRKVEDVLKSQNAYGETFWEIGEHTSVADINVGIDAFSRSGADVIVSVGGGSPIDASKAIIYRHHERDTSKEIVPHIAVPTTLSAAEYQISAGYTNESGDKVRLFVPQLAPSRVILDAELTLATPERLCFSWDYVEVSLNPNHPALEIGKGVNGLYRDIDSASDILTEELKKWGTSQAWSDSGYHAIGRTSWARKLRWARHPARERRWFYSSLVMHMLASLLIRHHWYRSMVVPLTIMAWTPPIRDVEYRLAAMDANSFPSQLLDALARYSYLVSTLGFRPVNIVVVGDSAGADLALTLTRYLVTYSDSLDRLIPPPGALVLLSPWVELNATHATPRSSIYTNARSDLLSPPKKEPDYAPAVFVGPYGVDFLANEYISPANKVTPDVSIKGFPRTFITLGDAETVVDSIRTLSKRMVADMGSEKVTTYVGKGSPHDFVAFEFFEPQLTEGAIAIGKWIEAL